MSAPVLLNLLNLLQKSDKMLDSGQALELASWPTPPTIPCILWKQCLYILSFIIM